MQLKLDLDKAINVCVCVWGVSRTQYWVYSSITLHLIYLRQGHSLKLVLMQ